MRAATMEQALAAALRDPRAALEQLDALRAERRLIDFIKAGWHALEPGKEFTTGWAVDAVCEHLEAVSRGEIKKLLINVPPGCTKSMTVNVFWPAWEWGPRNRPDLRYISASYGVDLTILHQLRCRDLMNSEWYQRHWGHRFGWKTDQNAKILYVNDRTGWRFAASVGKGITGYRGDRLIIDDPHNVQDVESDDVRETALRWFAETLPTRKNSEDTAFVVIMQRVHERDVSGFIIAKELGYEHLMLPMRFEPERACSTSIGFRDPRTEPGQLLWPERFSERECDAQEKVLSSWGGSYAVAGQMQQRPAPRGGGMFQRKDVQWLDVAPKCTQVVRGWDLAATKDGHGAFTACVKMGRLAENGRPVILDVQRGRWSPLEVRQAIKRCAEQDGRQVVIDIPQDPGQAGKSQVNDFVSMLEGWTVRFSPESGSKEDRARPLAAQSEGGNLYLVRAPWNDDFLNEACVFPNGEHKDQVDAASRAFSRLGFTRHQLVGGQPILVEG